MTEGGKMGLLLTSFAGDKTDDGFHCSQTQIHLRLPKRDIDLVLMCFCVRGPRRSQMPFESYIGPFEEQAIVPGQPTANFFC